MQIKTPLKSVVLFTMLFTSSHVFAETKKDCTYGRQIVKEKDETYYIVHKRAPTLYMISRDLYGTDKNWQDIAKWNKISSPYVVQMGQRLKIEAVPKINEAEANEILMKNWTNLKFPGQAKKIADYSAEYPKGCYAPATEEKETAAVVVAAPAEEVVKSHSEAVPEAVSEVERAPAPIVVVKPKLEKHEEHAQEVNHEESHSVWKFFAGVTASKSTLKNETEASGLENTLQSKLGYGIDLRANYHLAEKIGIFLAGGYDRVEFDKSDYGEITNSAQNLIRYSLGAEYEVREFLAVSLSYGNVQRVVAVSATAGTDLDTVTVPEVAIGIDLRLWKNQSNELWLALEVMRSMEKHEKDHELEAGTDYAAGINFHHKLEKMTLNISPMYQVVKADSQISKTEQDSIILKAGLNW